MLSVLTSIVAIHVTSARHHTWAGQTCIHVCHSCRHTNVNGMLTIVHAKCIEVCDVNTSLCESVNLYNVYKQFIVIYFSNLPNC